MLRFKSNPTTWDTSLRTVYGMGNCFVCRHAACDQRFKLFIDHLLSIAPFCLQYPVVTRQYMQFMLAEYVN